MIDVGHPVLQSCHKKLVSSILTIDLSAGCGVTFSEEYCYYNITTNNHNQDANGLDVQSNN